MNLKQLLLSLLFLLAFVHTGTQAQTDDGGDDDGWDDDGWDDDAEGYGLCYYDAKCLFSCGDALNAQECLDYQQQHPDSAPIDVPYYKAPGGECVATSKEPDDMGYCCTSCDENDEDYFCTSYYNNPDGCVLQGYKYFYNRIDAYYAGAESLDGFCYQVDVLGNRISSGSGDPHFKTWTGDKFDYHGECDLVLIDNPSFMDGLGLKLHIRTTRIKYFSFIERIALQIGDNVLEFANDVDNFLINGKKVQEKKKHHKTMFAGFWIRRDPTAISIRLHDEGRKHHDGQAAKIDFHARKIGFPAVVVDGGITDVFKGSLGLLGDWSNGKKMARDGKTIIDQEDATDYALEWQVRDTEPQLFLDARFPQFPTQCTPPAKMMGTRLGASHLRAQAEEVCASWKADKEDCIFDVMATRDIEVAKEGAIKTA